jgi:hypothetical protein
MTKQGSESVRHRSPAYPAVGLRNAIERLRNLYTKDGKAGAPAQLAAIHIGFGKAHGQALAVLAALKKFGLISETGGRFAPTQRGLEIINLPANDPRRQKALQEALLEPAIYRELIEQHRETGWPADDVLASELVTYKQFNPKAVNGFVQDLRDSLEFAGLSDVSALESGTEEESDVTEASVYGSQEKAAKLMLGQPSAHSTSSKLMEISLPVGTEGGEIVFATVRFSAGIKRNLVASLRALLEAMEKTLP